MRRTISGPPCAPLLRLEEARISGEFSYLSVYQREGGFYSYLRDSTGSIEAARLAGRVPKMTPMAAEVPSAMTMDQGLMGTMNDVKSRAEMGRERPRSVPTMPPASEMNTASMRNCSLISR